MAFHRHSRHIHRTLRRKQISSSEQAEWDIGRYHSDCHLPIRTMPVPGRRCPTCLAKGVTIWVIPGKRCSNCGTEVN
ncbi:hypothetical protein EJ03DRAFT_312272 [Teratosphaeria nubilosa]|uniref:Uncharacterized protein n=1 Tax=Teratosphaeria nubilosa TaxID=161662 RepID=A0A6G1LAD0_9PEZI|nr:hypothetical protein EJ03DRAFT_312272 [Teratosphaeria nubilosa]